MNSHETHETQLLTYDFLHLRPHAVKGGSRASLIVDMLLEGVHAPWLRHLTVLSPQIHNILLQESLSV